MLARLAWAWLAVLALSAGEPMSHTTDSLDAVTRAVAGGTALLVDVRERGEWDAGHLAAARLVPLSVLKESGAPGDLPKDRPIYLHCRSGRRCLTAAEILRAAGYDARPLKAGYEELKAAGVGAAPGGDP